MNSKPVQNRIKEFREKKGLSQKELGEMLDLCRETVSRIENGSSALQIDRAEQIAEILDTDAVKIMGYSLPEDNRKLQEKVFDYERKIKDISSTHEKEIEDLKIQIELQKKVIEGLERELKLQLQLNSRLEKQLDNS